MEDYGMVTAMAVVKVKTEFGKRCLREIQGLREGTLLKGNYYPESEAFDFKYDGHDAMLWVGQNAELVSLGEGQEHRYMMLDRLLLDCKYFIKMSPVESLLYHPNIARHMSEMRKLWNELNIKPEWLSYKQLGRIEHKMNVKLTIYNRKKKRNQ